MGIYFDENCEKMIFDCRNGGKVMNSNCDPPTPSVSPTITPSLTPSPGCTYNIGVPVNPFPGNNTETTIYIDSRIF